MHLGSPTSSWTQHLLRLPHQHLCLQSQPHQCRVLDFVTLSLLVFPPCPADLPSQASKLGGSSLSAADRIRRAWTAGCWAKAVAENQITTPNRSVQLDLRPRFYAVLRAEDSSGPFLCLSATTYWRLVGRIQDNDSISHAFPSELEAKVYFAGASAPDYQRLQ